MIGCPIGYRSPSKKSANICLDKFCPIPSDMRLKECMNSCNELNQCNLFNHVNIGKYSQCYLYGFDEDKGDQMDSTCGNKVGNTCCEKGKTKLGCNGYFVLNVKYLMCSLI